MTTFVFNVHCILLSHLTCKILTLKDYNIFKWERFFLKWCSDDSEWMSYNEILNVILFSINCKYKPYINTFWQVVFFKES